MAEYSSCPAKNNQAYFIVQYAWISQYTIETLSGETNVTLIF